MKKLILAIITLILSYYPVYADSFSSVQGLEVETKIMNQLTIKFTINLYPSSIY